MRFGFENVEMFIDRAFDRRIQLLGAIQSRSGLNVGRIEREPNARVPVVHLGTMPGNDSDAFVFVQFYPEEDEQPIERLPVAGEGAYGCALLVHYFFIHEIIQDSCELDHIMVREWISAAASFLIDRTLRFRRRFGNIHCTGLI